LIFDLGLDLGLIQGYDSEKSFVQARFGRDWSKLGALPRMTLFPVRNRVSRMVLSGSQQLPVVGVGAVPLFMAKKEVFAWLKAGTKTIEVRKGRPWSGAVAIFQSGANYLELPIVKKETGTLREVITQENFKSIVPTAEQLKDALDYLHGIYGTKEGVFTAYHLAQTGKR
jgi:ASC-1-like (ASCH) protein